jgi:hypothetical protein
MGWFGSARASSIGMPTETGASNTCPSGPSSITGPTRLASAGSVAGSIGVTVTSMAPFGSAAGGTTTTARGAHAGQAPTSPSAERMAAQARHSAASARQEAASEAPESPQPGRASASATSRQAVSSLRSKPQARATRPRPSAPTHAASSSSLSISPFASPFFLQALKAASHAPRQPFRRVATVC